MCIHIYIYICIQTQLIHIQITHTNTVNTYTICIYIFIVWNIRQLLRIQYTYNLYNIIVIMYKCLYIHTNYLEYSKTLDSYTIYIYIYTHSRH